MRIGGRHPAALLLAMGDSAIATHLSCIGVAIIIVEVCIQLYRLVHLLLQCICGDDSSVIARERRMSIDSASSSAAAGDKVVVCVLRVQTRTNA